MTTNEFIKLLQEADPSGNAHIRMEGGVPYGAELKEGYWDGPYSYINEEGKWVHSTKGMKVDIFCKDPEDMVDEILWKWNPFKETSEGLWEKVESLFVFDLTYCFESQREERKREYLKPVKEHFDWYVNFREESLKKDLNHVINLYKRGCRFFQKKDTENKWRYYKGWKFINESNPKDIGAPNLLHTYPILNSGKFEVFETDFFDDGEYYEFVLIE